CLQSLRAETPIILLPSMNCLLQSVSNNSGLTFAGLLNVNKRILSFLGPCALVGLISIAATPAVAAQSTAKKATKSTATHKATAAKAKAAAATASKPATTPVKAVKQPPRTLYSAQRSLSRKATLARARSIATARAINDATPHYKMSETGDLLPDVH